MDSSQLQREHGNEQQFNFAPRDRWAAMQSLMQSTTVDRSPGQIEGQVETAVDQAIASYQDMTDRIYDRIVAHSKAPEVEGFLEDTFVSTSLKGCIFVGHLATDLDSIAGAIGAAELYGGVATRAEEEVNGEITYALEEVAGLELPPLFDETPGASVPDAAGQFKRICLVDHNDENQMVKSLRNDPKRMDRIVGCIDHHALSTTFSSKTPLFLDIRPWGCMCSIVAHQYIRNNAAMKPEVARLMMCAILSDTLNLQSVTTTDADRFAVALLAKFGCVKTPDNVARLMFRAKTNWIASLGPYAMVRGDQKDFKWGGWKVGIAVLEVTDVEPVLAHTEDLLLELRFLKKEKGGAAHRITDKRVQGSKDAPHAEELDFAFLFVVDVLKQCSVLLICGGREHALACKAFPECPFKAASDNLWAPGQTISVEQTLCDVGPLVSRKAQFAPAISAVLEKGFSCHRAPVASAAFEPTREDEVLREALDNCDVLLNDDQQFVRQMSNEVRDQVLVGQRRTTTV